MAKRWPNRIGGTFHEVDVTDFAGTEEVLAQAIEALGGLHIGSHHRRWRHR